MSSVLQLARLNLRVAKLALRGRWLGNREFAAGYDKVAATYDSAWQWHLRSVTDQFLDKLPYDLEGSILDLGSGTGYTANSLAQVNPLATVVAVDVSAAMLDVARKNGPKQVSFVVADMLEFLRQRPNSSATLIVSTWALGYSHPAKLFRECGRVLKSGSKLGFIVNYADTLTPIFRTFRRAIIRFPDLVQRAAWPRFPRDWHFLETQLNENGFIVEGHEDGQVNVDPPEGPLLPWLQKTGILAGFDSMLDLSGEVADFFESEMASHRSHITHHYAMAVARKL